MDFSKAFVIVGIALVVVILFNVGIYFGYARKNSRNEFNDMIHVMKNARNPWSEEDANLKELSRRVDSLVDKEHVAQNSRQSEPPAKTELPTSK
jgi:site-specific DNA-adenine methylase